MPGFHTNIISFPQEILELNKLNHYWSSLQVHDVVNVTLSSIHDAEPAAPVRGRVLALEPNGFRVQVGTAEHVVTKEQVTQRIALPWKPADLKDYFVIFRRRRGQSEEYVEDLRVRRGVIWQILQLLTHRDFFRPHQGEETRHYYYNACDILGDHDIDELFPEEDFVPPDLNIQ